MRQVAQDLINDGCCSTGERERRNKNLNTHRLVKSTPSRDKRNEIQYGRNQRNLFESLVERRKVVEMGREMGDMVKGQERMIGPVEELEKGFGLGGRSKRKQDGVLEKGMD